MKMEPNSQTSRQCNIRIIHNPWFAEAIAMVVYQLPERKKAEDVESVATIKFDPSLHPNSVRKDEP